MLAKIDLKKRHKELFSLKRKPHFVVAPTVRHLALDGAGDPNDDAFRDAVQALYSAAYGLKFHCQRAGRVDYVVAPLECLWWAEDPTAFDENRRDEWIWRLMSMQPDEVTAEDLAQVVADLTAKGRPTPEHSRLCLETLSEGRCVQALHVGPYDAIGLTIEAVKRFTEEQGCVMAGKHHEVYLSDPRRTEPSRLKTVVRWPVADAC